MASAPGTTPRPPEPPTGESMIGSGAALQDLRKRIRAAARFDEPVFVIGESGTGKELVARQIHALSARGGRPHHVVNCAGLGADVLASELFGHRRGGFTGASHDRRGRVRAAHESTLILDEVSEAPAALQAGLLRVVEQGELQPVGDDSVVRVDVRFIATSNRPLATLLDGSFRHDLLHRLAALVIVVPALRDRDDDIDELATHFLAGLDAKYGSDTSLTEGARLALRQHSFPGNVRELRQVVLRAYAQCESGKLTAPDIEQCLLEHGASSASASATAEDPGSADTSLASMIRRHIRRVIARADGNLSAAARLLEIPRSTLQHYLVKYSIESPSRSDRDRRAARQG